MQASIVGLETRSSTRLFLRRSAAFGTMPCQRLIGAPHRQRSESSATRPNAFGVERFLVRRVRLRELQFPGSRIGRFVRCTNTFRECAKRKARAGLRRNADLSRGAAEGDVRRPTLKRRELRAIVRAAIAEELQALYRVEQDVALPERLTDLLRRLDSRNDETSSGDTRSKSDANGNAEGHS
jgi:hypothetical protein